MSNFDLTSAKVIHHIVIVGGGAGGLELATQLGNSLGKAKKAKITLVDQRLTHIWKPLLHEIAAGTLNPSNEETNYYAHAAKHHYEFVLGHLDQVDAQAKSITLSKTRTLKNSTDTETFSLSYDTLILAVGSVSNDFNTAGVAEHCYYLDTPDQAQIFQQDLLHLYLDAQNQSNERELNIGIIGAGATGVELAGELVQAKEKFYNYGLNKINPEKVKITLIEGAARILPALSEKMAAHSTEQLKDMHVEVLTNKRVEKVDAEFIYFNDGSKVPADLKVWAAGIKTPPIIQALEGFEKDRMGRLHVYATLQTKSDPNIFALGDCAYCILDAREAALGPRAQVASQQATFLAEAMKDRIAERALPMFKFSEKGSLVSLSEHKAVGELLGQVNVQGVIAKSMYVSLYRLHQATIYGYAHAGLLTAKDFVTRKIVPKIKLH
ncbi:NAD(P)/FAD-dependent oxidoreductase [Acinetobacter lanii]|uniref:NAD(P)/FAD-dependent oxidoreductase n=1 Tax=Acinetobacter lanii TaxID=2715163 RepID=A0A6G8S5H0_9GAMM|nr:NAD(P)/FAD-dependent oxidoreductase [Acinetobacter lanii]QIO09392.1 NAD(P)/FAD-dependent oxidoreductase [Acinetobacter lanii]